MSKIYLKVVDAEITFTNSFDYQRKVDGKPSGKKLFIHTYGIKCVDNKRTSRFIVKTFGNEFEDPYCEVGDHVNFTGTLNEEKWKDDDDNWVSRVTIIADTDSFDIKGVDDEDDEEEVKPKKKSRK